MAQEADLEGEYEGVVGTRTKWVDEACNQGGGGSVGHPVAVSFGQVAEQEADWEEEQDMISGSMETDKAVETEAVAGVLLPGGEVKTVTTGKIRTRLTWRRRN